MQKSKNKGRPAKPNAPNNGRNTLRPKIAKRPDGNKQQPGNAARANRPAVVAPGLDEQIITTLHRIPLFEAAITSKLEVGSNEAGTLINTPEKQIRCIQDLYALVKAQPKYKNLKEPNWKPDTNPLQVINWLLRKLGPLAKGDNWTIDYCSPDVKALHCSPAPGVRGSGLDYRFVIIREFRRCAYTTLNGITSGPGVENRNYFLALDFLPLLKKKDEPLHDLIIDAVALVSKKCKLPLWDEDGDFSEELTHLIASKKAERPPLSKKKMAEALRQNPMRTAEEIEYMRNVDGWTSKDGKIDMVQTNSSKDRQRISYTTGPAAQYLKLIKSRRKVITEALLRETYSRVKPPFSQRKRCVMNWARWALKLNGNIKDYSVVPNYSPKRDKAFTPFNMYKIVWSGHDNDVLKRRFYNGPARKVYLPVMHSETTATQLVIKPVPEYDHDFPPHLSFWIKTGLSHFVYRFGQYFYGASAHSNFTPAEIAMGCATPKKKKDRKKLINILND